MCGFRFCPPLHVRNLRSSLPLSPCCLVNRLRVSQKVSALCWTALSLMLVFCLPFAWLHKLDRSSWVQPADNIDKYLKPTRPVRSSTPSIWQRLPWTRKPLRQAQSRPHDMHITAFEDVPYSAKLLTASRVGAVELRVASPLSFRVGRPVVINTGGRTEELHEIAKYTREGIVVKKPLAYSHDGGERVTQQAIVPQEMPNEVVQDTAALTDTAHTKGNLEQDVQHETHDTGALLSVDGSSSWETVNLDLPLLSDDDFKACMCLSVSFVFRPKKVHLGRLSPATPLGKLSTAQESEIILTTCQPNRQLQRRAVEACRPVWVKTHAPQGKPWTRMPWHHRKTTWRRARAFRFLLFCAQKKKCTLQGSTSNSSGETCHHARQCENYDHMPTSSQARTLDVEGDLTAAPDQEVGVTQAHVCCSVPRLSAAHAAAPLQLRTPFRKLFTSLCHTHLRWNWCRQSLWKSLTFNPKTFALHRTVWLACQGPCLGSHSDNASTFLVRCVGQAGERQSGEPDESEGHYSCVSGTSK